MLNVLRSSPCAEHDTLITFDSLHRSGISSITNCALNDTALMQASLPIKDGGLGIRSVVMLAPSAFLSSAASTQLLQSAIFGFDWPHSNAAVIHIHNISFHLFHLISAPLRSNGADYILLLFILYFIFILFTVRSQKLLDRFSPNFQELCILV